MTRKINETGLDFIKQWEGLKLTAYLDAAGIWTIGYGHTRRAGEPYPYKGMKITQADADRILLRDLAQYEYTIENNVKVDLTDNQFSALVSFCFNVGPANFRKSTLLKKLNAGDYNAVPAELMKWVYAGGKRIQGLVNRRAAETGLWAKGAFVSSGYTPATARKDRAILTPEAIGPVAGAMAGVGSVAYGSGPLQWALAIVMVIGCLVGAWYFIRRVQRETA